VGRRHRVALTHFGATLERERLPDLRARDYNAFVSENQLYDFQCVLVALLAGSYLLLGVLWGLRRVQPGLAIGWPVVVAFGLRVIAASTVSETPFASGLRGGDEPGFLLQARSVSHWDFLSQTNLDAMTSRFHIFFFALNDRLFRPPPDVMLRIEVISLAVVGMALLAAGVYELAGRRAAVIVAWVLALEPANVFFSGILHKEPFMLLAEGLVAYGGAILWRRGDFRALVPMIAGCLLATATRPYVGWFLSAATAAVALHASLRSTSPRRSLVLAAVVLGLIGAFIPTVWNASSKEKLAGLQASQDANAADTRANLSLERVDYSTRDKIVVNLPKRVLDIVTKPYPWQTGNTSQQLGVLGTLFMFAGLLLLAGAILRQPSAIMRRAGPLIYPALFLLVAYSLSAGNAGTAYRYRTHLVAFLFALAIVLREQHIVRDGALDEAGEPELQPASATSSPRSAAAPTLGR